MSESRGFSADASTSFNKVANVLKDNIKKVKDKDPVLPFWHVGRTYNTCTDYIAQNGSRFPRDLQRYNDEVRPECQQFYLAWAGNLDNQKWWWDDYGWWGLAHLAAKDSQNAIDCWRRMKTYGVDGSGLSDPAYKGGCWNHTPSQDPAGCENSVTNSAYFLLSLRLLNDASLKSNPIRAHILTAAADWAT